MTKGTTQHAGRNTTKVWRIFHFEQRFEMDGYVRQGGLDYVRMFVTATTKDKSNESTEFLGQLAELEHYYPEQRDAYEGRFWRLCRLTAPQEDWLRGYLVDADQKPLTIAKLAARLHLSQPVMKQTLAALKRVGLIEQIGCPAFQKPDRDADEAQKGRKGQTGAKGRRTAKKTGSRGKGKGGAKAAARAAAKDISKRFETFGKTKKTFKENQTQSELESKDQDKEILGQSSSDPNAQGESPQTDKTDRSQATRTALAPTTAPLMNPTPSDAGGAERVIPFAGPPGSDYAGQLAVQARRHCSNPVRAMARMIYEALGGPWAGGSKAEAQDLGAFASAVERLHASGLPPPAAAELWESLVKEARRLRKLYARKGGYQSAKKVWFKPIFRDKLAKRVAAGM